MAIDTGGPRQGTAREAVRAGTSTAPAPFGSSAPLALAHPDWSAGLVGAPSQRLEPGSLPGAARRAVPARRLAPWAVFAGTTAFFSALVTVYWKPAGDDINDASYYMDLAKNPLRFPRAPFGFRILTPYLVWLSHLPRVYAFAAITVLSLAAAAAFLYMYLREIYSAPVALLGVGLYAVCPAPLIELKNPVDVDSLFFAMVALAFYALARRRWVVLVGALVTGVLDKETMLFVLLPVAVVAVSDYRLKPYRRWAAVFGLPILVYALLHYTPLVFRPLPHNYNYLSGTNISFVFRAQQVINGGGPGYSFAWSMLDTFGALWVLSALLVWRSPRLVRQTAIFIVPVLASVLIATDWARMLAAGFIVMIPLVCAAGLRRPIATVVMFGSYAAVVPLGLDDPRLHPSLTYFLPLLVVCAMAALVIAMPRRARVSAPSVAAGPATARAGAPPRLAPIAAAVPAAGLPSVAPSTGTPAGHLFAARRPKRLSPAPPERPPIRVVPAPAAVERPPVRVVPVPAGPRRPARPVPVSAPAAASVEHVPEHVPCIERAGGAPGPIRSEPTAAVPAVASTKTTVAPAPEAPPRAAPAPEAPRRSTPVPPRPTRVAPAPEAPPRVAPAPERQPARPPERVAAAALGAPIERARSRPSRAVARFRDAIPQATASRRTPESTGKSAQSERAQPEPTEGRTVEVRPSDAGLRADRVPASTQTTPVDVAVPASAPRSEPILHLENAEALLADVQQLLANATARVGSGQLGDTAK